MSQSLYRSPAGQEEVMSFYDGLLDQWPVPAEHLTIKTRHGDTFVIACGAPAAPPVVLLHGSCSNAASWAGEAAEYSRHFRVYAVDCPGEPGRSAPSRPPWIGPAYAEWMEDLLDGLQVQSASLVGLSQGGWIALKFATSRPDRVSRLVLLAPGGIAPARLSFILRSIPLSILGRRGAEAITRIVFGKQSFHPVALAFMNLIMTHFRARVGALPIFSDRELQQLTMPALVIIGAQDAILPASKIASRLAELAPQHLTVRLLPDAGHVLVNQTGSIVPFLTARAGND